MADALYDYYNDILDSNFERSTRLNLEAIGLPTALLHHLENLFTVEEVWRIVNDLPNDKAPGLDGFTGLF
jgi:hypothetical protein